jgi:hypothetical protein
MGSPGVKRATGCDLATDAHASEAKNQQQEIQSNNVKTTTVINY